VSALTVIRTPNGPRERVSEIFTQPSHSKTGCQRALASAILAAGFVIAVAA
jgi:hypothetical protein